MTTFDDAALGEHIQRAFGGFVLPAPAARPMPLPRHRPTRRWLAPIGVAVALLVGVPIATAPPAVFATWTPAPGILDPAVVAAVEASCAVGPGADAPVRDRVYHAQIAALPLAVVDQRGRAAMLFYAKRTPIGIATNLCLGAVDQFGTYLGGGGGSGLGATEEPADGPIRIVTGVRNTRHGPDIWTMIRGGDTYTAVAGTLHAEIARVVVQRDTGGPVTASINDGFFAAWWPGTASATWYEAYDGDGTMLAKVEGEDWSADD